MNWCKHFDGRQLYESYNINNASKNSAVISKTLEYPPFCSFSKNSTGPMLKCVLITRSYFAPRSYRKKGQVQLFAFGN